MLQQPFFQVTLPLMVTLIIAYLNQNKRLDDLIKRLDRIEEDMKEIKKDIINIKERIQAIELTKWR